MKTGRADPRNLIQKVDYQLEMDELCFPNSDCFKG